MDDAVLSDIELITDGDGIALLGPAAAVDLFLTSQRLESRDLDLGRLRGALGNGAAAAKAGSEVAANSGRWMKLTEESWQAAQQLTSVTNASTGNLHATLRAPNGQFVKNLQFLKTPGAMLTNPAMLAGAAGLMAQVAMQQTMEEITEYLAVIDEKVDDIIRAQKDAVLADMIGVDLVIEEAMVIRKEVGSVSSVTWSKVQSTPMTIARTQAYALRRLDALAEKLESKSVNELADVTKKIEQQTQEWLAVIAHCFYLQDAVGIIEIDRVLTASPEELDRHRIALRTARINRAELITRTTRLLLTRMDSAASVANTKVLFNPMESPAIVRSRNRVADSVASFHDRLGIEGATKSVESRRWSEAFADSRDSVVKASTEGMETAVRAGAEGVEFATRVGAKGVDKAKLFADSVSAFADQKIWRRARDRDSDE